MGLFPEYPSHWVREGLPNDHMKGTGMFIRKFELTP